MTFLGLPQDCFSPCGIFIFFFFNTHVLKLVLLFSLESLTLSQQKFEVFFCFHWDHCSWVKPEFYIIVVKNSTFLGIKRYMCFIYLFEFLMKFSYKLYTQKISLTHGLQVNSTRMCLRTSNFALLTHCF